MIQSIQKVIKIGSSAGVTIPAKLLNQAGIQVGDEVEVTISRVEKSGDTVDEATIETARRLMKKYEQALRNLADR
jgi:putative addiction module antidote